MCMHVGACVSACIGMSCMCACMHMCVSDACMCVGSE